MEIEAISCDDIVIPVSIDYVDTLLLIRHVLLGLFVHKQKL